MKAIRQFIIITAAYLLAVVNISAFACSDPPVGKRYKNFAIEFISECTTFECEEEKKLLRLRGDVPYYNCVANVYFSDAIQVVAIYGFSCFDIPNHFIGRVSLAPCLDYENVKIVSRLPAATN
ncbi:MAG: hypothetical protein HWE13_09050 [Gammaproteobacteria bacterium]|nr:hypothetical protein [Gammaproteobacteria bacterium]